ncbi:phosphodiester glycosidase family protein [Parapedobacter tibetensis]|uniref:phosphodiester glycosidase family protein n=1 Tax=Parapedobacter tibetensis TaxID=2972951 RepID=UPI00214DEA35|nr:phosphodiester glycosidase family protein [Parapedobacter tibetensis]
MNTRCFGLILLLFIGNGISITFSSCTKQDPVVDGGQVELTPLTQILVDSTGLISRVFSDSTFVVAPGVEETDIHYLSMNGYTMRAFILKIDLNTEGVSCVPLTPYGSVSYGMQTIPDMLQYVISPTGSVPVAGINADFYNMSTGEPRSIVQLDGVPIRTVIPEGRSFFGFLENGDPIIGGPQQYLAFADQITNALGGHHRLIDHGQIVSQTDLSIEPRTAVGFTADETLYFIVVDGRRFDYSNGITLLDLAIFMNALGAKESINLDGGGSSTFVIRHPMADVWHVRNRPSDGAPRSVANGWAILAEEQ